MTGHYKAKKKVASQHQQGSKKQPKPDKFQSCASCKKDHPRSCDFFKVQDSEILNRELIFKVYMVTRILVNGSRTSNSVRDDQLQ
uniref:Uncharacterized protein n=1 Tax=Romanomermis culicivorax TaxID=13658 RepID=A0A915KA39_ROMCU